MSLTVNATLNNCADSPIYVLGLLTNAVLPKESDHRHNSTPAIFIVFRETVLLCLYDIPSFTILPYALYHSADTAC